MDVNALKAIVDRMSTGSSSGNSWFSDWFKPDENPTTIRVLPYPHNTEDIPFFAVHWHYDIGGERSLVCPKHHDGSPCPVCELAQEFRSLSRGGGKDDPNWKIFQDLQAKPRFYAPVLIRGQEAEGVKLWGFPVSIFKYFAEMAQDPDWGDFTDPTEGHDVTVQILLKNTPQNTSSYNRPNASLKPKVSPIFDDKAKTKELLLSIPDYFEIDPTPFPIKEEAELISLVKRIGASESDNEIDTGDLTMEATPKSTASGNDALSSKLDSLLDD